MNGDPYDPTQTTIEQIGITKQLQLRSTQPKLSGVLKFNVKIVSPEIIAESPEGVWTVNMHSC